MIADAEEKGLITPGKVSNYFPMLEMYYSAICLVEWSLSSLFVDIPVVFCVVFYFSFILLENVTKKETFGMTKFPCCMF